MSENVVQVHTEEEMVALGLPAAASWEARRAASERCGDVSFSTWYEVEMS